jgi:hypothetical protein
MWPGSTPNHSPSQVAAQNVESPFFTVEGCGVIPSRKVCSGGVVVALVGWVSDGVEGRLGGSAYRQPGVAFANQKTHA